MYSYEDRIRAVKLYIQMGKRSGATIRQLGYPTKNSLKSWYEEYERRLDLPAGYVRSKPKYSQHQKAKAVEHYVQHGHCIAFTIRALGYPALDSLRAWIAELRPETRKLVVARAESLARPPAMKKAAVIDLCTRQGGARAVAQELGVSRPTLYNWKNQLLGPEKPASMKRRHETPPSSERKQLERQVESLRRDVYRLQLEHDRNSPTKAVLAC